MQLNQLINRFYCRVKKLLNLKKQKKNKKNNYCNKNNNNKFFNSNFNKSNKFS